LGGLDRRLAESAFPHSTKTGNRLAVATAGLLKHVIDVKQFFDNEICPQKRKSTYKLILCTINS